MIILKVGGKEVQYTPKGCSPSLIIAEYERARAIAEASHAHKEYNGESYLSGHLIPVVNKLVKYAGIAYDENLITEYIAAGFMHDSIEDAGFTYNNIRDMFGIFVAEICVAVTNDVSGRTREDRAAPTYPKMRAFTHAIPVKLADRIVNSNGKMARTYSLEYPGFREKLYLGIADHEPMWTELDQM